MENVDFYPWMNRHGYPHGWHYSPTPLELIDLLADRLAGRPLPDPFLAIFTDVRIRDFKPADLHEQYKEREEGRYIYFFSEREFAKTGGISKRPVRQTTNGVWKASGSSKPVTSGSGVEVGMQLTMVFHEKRFPDDKKPAKTDWAMHEFAMIIGPDKKLANMAIYRLYMIRSGKVKANARSCVADNATMHDDPQCLLPLLPAGPNNHEASTSASHAQPQARANFNDQPRWAMPVTLVPPLQLQDAGNTSYIRYLPASSMAATPAANYMPLQMSHHHEGVSGSSSVNWQLGEEFSCLEYADSAGQLLKDDLPPSSTWSAVPLREEDHGIPMTDEEKKLCTFTMDELLGHHR